MSNTRLKFCAGRARSGRGRNWGDSGAESAAGFGGKGGLRRALCRCRRRFAGVHHASVSVHEVVPEPELDVEIQLPLLGGPGWGEGRVAVDSSGAEQPQESAQQKGDAAANKTTTTQKIQANGQVAGGSGTYVFRVFAGGAHPPRAAPAWTWEGRHNRRRRRDRAPAWPCPRR